jgi:hypothetical protein
VRALFGRLFFGFSRAAGGSLPQDGSAGVGRREFAAYGVLALASVLPALLHPGSIVGDGVDAFGTHWFYWWTRTCIEHLQNPGFTNLFFYPSGKDVFAHTGLNLVDAALSVPFQWVFGPTLYQPLFIVVLQLGNALSMRALAADVFADRRTVVVSTLLWMTNPFVLYELTDGRPTQAFLWFIPAAFLYLRRSARQPGWGNAVGLGLSVAMAGWSYWFNGYFLVLLLLPLAAFELRDAPDRRGALARWVVGALLCLLLVTPAIWAMAGAYKAGSVPGGAAAGGIFDAPSGIGEGGLTAYRGLWLLESTSAPQLLQPAWGIPLLLALLWRGGALARPRWAVMLIVGLVVAVGPILIAGDPPVLWTPYMLLYRVLPFFNRLWFPYRVLGVAFVPACLLIGAWAARFRWLPGMILTLSLAGQAFVSVWPLSWHSAASPPLLTSLRKEGGALIFMPFKVSHDGLMWQTEFELPTFGGMGETAPAFWPADFRPRLSNGYIRALRGAVMVPARAVPFAPQERNAIANAGFRWVALRISQLDMEVARAAERGGAPADKRRSRLEAVQMTSRVVGSEPVGLDGDVVLWDMQGTLQPPAVAAYSEARLADALGWSGKLTALETRMMELGRVTEPVMQDIPVVEPRGPGGARPPGSGPVPGR